MPHVIVKLYSVRQKARLTKEATKAIVTTLGYGDESVSVGIEDVEPKAWAEKLYEPDILGKPDMIYKKPATIRSDRVTMARALRQRL